MLTAFPDVRSCNLAVIGLGYVGLPLAVEFAKPQADAETGGLLHRRVIGFDISSSRIDELTHGFDRTSEISSNDLSASVSLVLTCDRTLLAEADVFIVTVPTPIDSAKRPDLSPLEKASRTIGEALKIRKHRSNACAAVIIYESTVYPGVTEDFCVPILESCSGLDYNVEFFCGYSPERINPGDQEHRLSNIVKVTSGSTPDAADWIDKLYGSIIMAGTYKARSIKVAEAAKVIENTQRDLNIALINELAVIFTKMNIDTLDVLDAAATKWNFLPFRPGLVGGHCIGVDPYYLTFKAELTGYYPHLILAGRRINDGMGKWFADQAFAEAARRGIITSNLPVLILGLTFKEDCPDLRNTRVIDIIETLLYYRCSTTVVDPLVDTHEALQTYGIKVENTIPKDRTFSIVIVAVAHHQFKALTNDQWTSMIHDQGFFVDVKGIVPRSLSPLRP